MVMIEREVIVPVGQSEAWELLTDPAELERWLGDEVDLEPAEGAVGRVVDRDGTDRALRIEHVDAGRRLCWRWWPADGGDGPASRVEITVAPVEGGTRVRVVERALPGAVEAKASAAAWSHRLLHLELLVLLGVAATVRM